ncbi:MAG: redoxin domain-containing protein [Alphaproteobacteria bacterium]|nr:redoxin domain-containing protein [Alphaproteobacteria bacterium]
MNEAGNGGGKPSWSRGLVRGLGLAAVLAVGIGVGVLIARPHGAAAPTAGPEEPVLGQAPTYTLKNQVGDTVSSSQFAGKVRVVTFLFPYCRTYCPLITAHLIGFEHLLEQNGLADKVQLVAFNLAPGDAGQDVMQAYLKQYGWDPQDTRWQYLTGSPSEIRKVVRFGYHVDFERVQEEDGADDAASAIEGQPEGGMAPQVKVANPLADRADPGYDVGHNDALIVVDPRGRIRKIFDEADVLSNDELWAATVPLIPTGAKAGS